MDTHPTWSEGELGFVKKVDWKFVAVTWIWAALASIILAMIIGAVILALLDNNSEGKELPLMFGAFGTFIAFILVVNMRLRALEKGRFSNALAVAAIHVLVLFVFLMINLVLKWIGTDLSDVVLPGGNFTEFGLGFFALERSAVTAIGGCLLASAIIPERGPVPEGTQHATSSSGERSL